MPTIDRQRLVRPRSLPRTDKTTIQRPLTGQGHSTCKLLIVGNLIIPILDEYPLDYYYVVLSLCGIHRITEFIQRLNELAKARWLDVISAIPSDLLNNPEGRRGSRDRWNPQGAGCQSRTQSGQTRFR